VADFEVMTPRSWPGLPLVRYEQGQAARLQQFRADHPGVIVGQYEFGTWQAVIPEPSGETVITRYELRELLDKLDELTGD
jgi:hypothetical protein